MSEGGLKIVRCPKKAKFYDEGAHPVICSYKETAEALASWRGTWEEDVPKDLSQTTGLECVAQRDATDWVHPFQ